MSCKCHLLATAKLCHDNLGLVYRQWKLKPGRPADFNRDPIFECSTLMSRLIALTFDLMSHINDTETSVKHNKVHVTPIQTSCY